MEYLGHLRSARNGQALVQADNYWTGQRELHVYINRLSRWVDDGQCYIIFQCLQYIQVNLVPFINVCLEVDTLVDIKQLSTMARIIGVVDHINAEVNGFICSEFYIYLGYIIVDQLINCIKNLLVNNHSIVHTARKYEDGLGSDIILATYSCTQGDFGQAFLLGCEVELRQHAGVLEQ